MTSQIDTNGILIAQAQIEQTLFTTQVPQVSDKTDNVPYELGMKFQSSKAGQINAIRYWKAPSETGTHVGRIWSATGTLLASVTFTSETASGWQQQVLSTPLTIQANTIYVVSVNVNRYYPLTQNGLTSSVVSGDLSSVADTRNGVYSTSAGSFPSSSWQNTNYFRDVAFVASNNPPPSPTGNQTIFTTQVPQVSNGTDGVPYELGMKFRSAKAGQITAIRYWKAPSDTGSHVGKIWSSTGSLLASVAFANETASGWQQQVLNTPLNIQANTTYVVSVNISSHYVTTNSGLAASIVNGDLSSVTDGSNGVYGNVGSLPTNSWQNSNYFRDVVFAAGNFATLTKVNGDNQIGTAGAALANPFVVQVKDGAGNPQSGVTVNFAVTNGGGTVAPASAVTNASGQASTTLTLGTTANVANTVDATASNIGSVTFTARGTIANPNPIYLENQNTGTTNWKLVNRANGEIAGYASATSVNKGGTLDIKVSLGQAGQFTVDVYRLGYYGGTGGRLMASSGPLSGRTQPAATIDSNTRLVECNWATSYVVQVGTNWTSGLYVAKLIDQATSKVAHVWFIVRDDSSTANILFQSSVSTVLAYSSWGGYSLYGFNSIGGQRAFKVSYDRPYSQATFQQTYEADTPLRWEYNMIRWLESQGYDVTYTDNMQVHTNGQLLLNHKVFLSVGHDEYWSKEMRDNVEAARSAKVNLGLFSANSCYWRVRFENSTPASGQVRPNRVMACYKQDWALDPVAQQQGPSAATNKFRSAQNQRPENALFGVMYGSDTSNIYGGYNYVVTNSTDPYYANTGLKNGDQLSLLVGYEWDFIVNNGSTPAGLVTLSQSTVQPASVLPTNDEPTGEKGLPANQDFTKSHSVRYTASSGAKVFASGTIQWAWGLDSDDVIPARADTRVKQITVNILADMGARPQSPDANIIVP